MRRRWYVAAIVAAIVVVDQRRIATVARNALQAEGIPAL